MFVGLYWQRYGWIGPRWTSRGSRTSSGCPPECRDSVPQVAGPGEEPRLAAMIAFFQSKDTDSYRSFRSTPTLGRLARDDLALLLSERFATMFVRRARRGAGGRRVPAAASCCRRRRPRCSVARKTLPSCRRPRVARCAVGHADRPGRHRQDRRAIAVGAASRRRAPYGFRAARVDHESSLVLTCVPRPSAPIRECGSRSTPRSSTSRRPRRCSPTKPRAGHRSGN